MTTDFDRELNTNYNFPNINIYNTLNEGVHNGYEAIPHDGYVMYDTNDETFIVDPNTMEEIPVTYYYTMAGFPLNYNFDNFSWVAVLRSEIDENYIRGVEPEHEVM